MGLPIWRDPDEPKQQQKKKSFKHANNPTVAARSSIRRRPSVHGSRSRRLPRESTILPPPPRLERSPPPVPAIVSLRHSRRNGVPPNIPNLFEHNTRSTLLPPPPPPVPHSRNYSSIEQRERHISESLDDLREQTARLRRDHDRLIQGPGGQAGDPWTEAERRSLLETAAAVHSHRPGSRVFRARNEQPSQDAGASEPQGDDDEWRSAFVPIAVETGEPAEGRLSADAAPRTVLPTPPLDQSEQDGDSLFLPESRARTGRPLHPLSRSWSHGESPVNGLGDRNRSPTPGDAWEIMETTIEPDATLPSADSSFGTVPITNSFASSNDTTITEPEHGPAHNYSAEDGENDHGNDVSDNDSSSSIDLDCTDEEYMAQAESLAREMYFHEMSTTEGREQRVRPMILAMTASSSQSIRPVDVPVEIGFRLIDEALNTEEGRARVASLHGEDAVHRIVRFRNQPRSHSPPPPPAYRPHSPPSTTTSHDPPSANPVSPPSRSSIYAAPVQRRTDFSDVLLPPDLDSDEQEDLDQMRRVARRFATRDEVPDDWWASMGLNSSIARAPRHGNSRRTRSPDGVRRADMHVERAIGRVRAGRVERERERGNSRL